MGCNCRFDCGRTLAFGVVLRLVIAIRRGGGSSGRAGASSNHEAIRVDDSFYCSRLSVESHFPCTILTLRFRCGKCLRGVPLFLFTEFFAVYAQIIDCLDYGWHAEK